MKPRATSFIAAIGAVLAVLDARLIELGQIIRPDKYVDIEAKYFPSDDLDEDVRVRANYLSINIKKSNNVTAIRYDDILPFSAKGCMPVFYFGDNPPVIRRKDIRWIYLREQWTVILFANPVTNISQNVLDLLARSIVILGNFVGQGFSPKIERKILKREIMIIKNLAKPPDLGQERKSYTGYMLLFEILSRYTKDLPVLANLILSDQGSDRCKRRLGRRLEVLNHDFVGNIPISPKYEKPEIINEEVVKFNEHYGTHLEVPFHLLETGFTTANIPPDRAFVPCIRIQRYNKTWNNKVNVKDFQRWEARSNMRIPRGSFVFVDTHLNRQWPDYEEYVGWNPATETMNFLGVDPMAARWLVKSRGIIGIGIDTIDIDGSSGFAEFSTHYELARSGAIAIENVGRIDRLPNLDKEPTVHPVSQCLFVHLRIELGTAAPVAIFVHTNGLLNERFGVSCAKDIMLQELLPLRLISLLLFSLLVIS